METRHAVGGSSPSSIPTHHDADRNTPAVPHTTEPTSRPNLRLHAREEVDRDALQSPDPLDRARELLRFDRRGPRLRLIDQSERERSRAPEGRETDALGSLGDAWPHDRTGAAGRVADRLAEAIGPARFQRYFADHAMIEVKPRGLRVTAPTPALASLLDRRFGDAIRAAAVAEFGGVLTGLKIEFAAERAVKTEAEPPGTESRAARAPAAPMSRPAVQRVAAAAMREKSSQSSGRHYAFEDFVVGDSNRLAYNAAVQMAEGGAEGQRGSSMLFVHGPCGVGKTHLLQGLANRFRETHPGATVRVVTGEAFMNDFVNAIKAGGGSAMSGAPRSQAGAGGVERFRRQYRRCDLLCIDDVQFLASKQATQQELLHTFDEILLSGASVALVCDRHPRSIRQFSPALVSRFMSGMVASIDPPDAAVRQQAIRVIALRRGLALDDAAMRMLVDRTRSIAGAPIIGVREIEGIMTRIEAIHRLLPGYHGRGGTVGVLAVERALGDPGSGGAGASGEAAVDAGLRRPVRVETIISQTCTALGVETADLGAPTRHKRVVLARAVITHLSRELTTLSYPEIARAIGRPSHSTVITAHQRLVKQITQGESFGIGPDGESMTIDGLVRQLAGNLAKR